VLGFDPNAARVSLALELGADVAVSDSLTEAVVGFTNGHGADAVILTASSKSSEPINIAAEISRLKGRIVVVGLVGMTIDREPFYKRELELKLSMSYGLAAAIRHMSKGSRLSVALRALDRATQYGGVSRARRRRKGDAETSCDASLRNRRSGKGVRVNGERRATSRDSADLSGGAKGSDRTIDSTRSATAEKRRQPSRLHRPRQLRQGVLLPALKKASKVALSTVVTSTGVSAGHAGEKNGFAVIATDPAAALADPRPTRFSSPPGTTPCVPRGGRAKGGKHVFCEKPLAINAEGLAEVIAAARERREFSPWDSIDVARRC